MFGFLVILALFLALSVFYYFRTLGIRPGYEYVKKNPILFLCFGVIAAAEGLLALKIYITYLDTSPAFYRFLYDLQDDIRDGFFFSSDYWNFVADDFRDNVVPRWIFWSTMIWRLFHISQLEDQEFEELGYYLILPVMNILFTVTLFDLYRDWKVARQLPSFVLNLSSRLFNLLVATSYNTLTAYRYLRGIHTTTQLSTENEQLKKKLAATKASLSAALIREAQSVLTIALFGKELKANGDKIISLEATTKILDDACTTWYEESQTLKKRNPSHARYLSHEHQLSNMQAVIDSQAQQLVSLDTDLALAHRLRRQSSGTKFDTIEEQEAHDQEMIAKQAEIDALQESVREHEGIYFRQQQTIGTKIQELMTERALHHETSTKLEDMTITNGQNEVAVLELQAKLSKHGPGRCMSMSQLRGRGRPTTAKLAEMEAAYEQKFDYLIDDRSRLQGKLDRLESQLSASAHSAEDSKKLKQLESEKAALEKTLANVEAQSATKLADLAAEYEARLAAEAAEAQSHRENLIVAANKQISAAESGTKKAAALENKLTQIKTAYNALSQQHQQHVSDSESRVRELQAQLDAKDGALAEKTRAYDELVVSAGRQQSVGYGNEGQLAVLRAEVARLQNIEQDKTVAENTVQEAAARLHQAGSIINTQQRELAEKERAYDELVVSAAQKSSVSSNDEELAGLRFEAARLKNVEQEKTAAESAAQEAAARLQQAESMINTQQSELRRLAGLEQQLGAAQEAVNNATQQLNVVEAQKNAAEVRSTEVLGQLEALETQKHVAEERTKQATEQLILVQNEKDAAQTRATQATQHAESLQAVNNDQQNKLQWAEQRINQLESEANNGPTDLLNRALAAEAALAESQTTAAKYRSQVHDMAKQKIALTNELQGVKLHLEEALDEAAENLQEHDKVKKLLASARAKVERVLPEYQRLRDLEALWEEQPSAVSKFGDEISVLRLKLETSEKNRDEAARLITLYRGENKTLDAAVQSAEDEIEELTQYNDELEAEKKELSEEVQSLEADKKELQATVKILQDSQVELNGLVEEELAERTEELRVEKALLETELAAEKGKHSTLQATVQAGQVELNGSVEEEVAERIEGFRVEKALLEAELAAEKGKNSMLLYTVGKQQGKKVCNDCQTLRAEKDELEDEVEKRKQGARLLANELLRVTGQVYELTDDGESSEDESDEDDEESEPGEFDEAMD